MKRLIRKAFNLGSTVRFKNNSAEKGVLTVIQKNEDETYNLVNIQTNQTYENISDSELTGGKDFSNGDIVRYKKHPYDNKETFTVSEVLPNGNCFISNEERSYTDINPVNLEFA